MAIVAATIATAAKAAIATNPKFSGITPELDAVITAIADGVANAINTELGIIKTSYNLHVHAGLGTPPIPPLV